MAMCSCRLEGAVTFPEHENAHAHAHHGDASTPICYANFPTHVVFCESPKQFVDA
jgi:hypothetical protein